MIVDLISVPLIVRTHSGRKLEIISKDNSELIIIAKRKTLKDKREEQKRNNKQLSTD